MIRNKTAVIVGAGASADLGLPLGSTLKENVVNILSRPGSDDMNIILDYLTRSLGFDRREVERKVRDSSRHFPHIRQSRSIDNYLDQERSDEIFVALCKSAIALEIARGEKKSSLRGNGPQNSVFGSEEYFLWDIMNQAVRGVEISEVAEQLKNISFITFNYDRCLERFIDSWMTSRGLGPNYLRPSVHHVYGSIGPYPEVNPFEHEGQRVTSNPHFDLLPHSSGLKLFTEREDENHFSNLQGLVEESDVLVFLGFGFEAQNMSVFKPSKKRKWVFASVYDQSEPNQESIASELLGKFCKWDKNICFTAPVRAQQFLRDHDHLLGRAIGVV